MVLLFLLALCKEKIWPFEAYAQLILDILYVEYNCKVFTIAVNKYKIPIFVHNLYHYSFFLYVLGGWSLIAYPP